MLTITILDEFTQPAQSPWQLDIQTEETSLREILRSRIYQEVSAYNTRQSGQLFAGLVQAEPQTDEPVTLDWESHYEQALQAFNRRSYIVLVDQWQIVQLDEPIHLHPTSTVRFFKLFPIIGG